MSRRSLLHAMCLAALAITTITGVIVTPGFGSQRRGQTSESSAHLTGARAKATPTGITDDLYDAIQPGLRGGIAAETRDWLPRYTINATLVPPSDNSPATVAGTAEIRYVNTTGAPLTELPVRLLPNLRQFAGGRMEIRETTVDGRMVTPVAPALHAVPASTPVATPVITDAQLILARIPLRHQLAPGDSTTIAMSFTTTVPIGPPDESGTFRYHPDRGSWTLAGWYPALAGYDPELGWDLDPPAAWSDLAFETTALFDVTITAPPNLELVSPGIETRTTSGDNAQVRRFVSGPARGFPIIAAPGLASIRTNIDGTTVSVYFPSGSEDGAGTILEWSTRAFRTYSELFGAYPYLTLDIVAVPDVVGVEFSQVIWLGEPYIADPVAAESRPGAAEFLVAHEVAHQWWYGLVGNDPHRRAFLDEGLAEYSAVLYIEYAHGRDAARTEIRDSLTLPYAEMLIISGDAVVEQPASAFPNGSSYYATEYRKAALGFAAIRVEIGDDAFFTGLQRYLTNNQFAVATPGALLSAFQREADADLGDLWRLWFRSARGRIAIIMEPEVTPSATPTG